MMAGHVYLLVVSKAFGESRLKDISPDSVEEENNTGKPAFPTTLVTGLIVLFAVFWIYYSNQYRLLREWFDGLNIGFDFAAPLSLSLSAITITVLFLGGMVLTNRPVDPLRQLGRGLLTAAALFSFILGGVYLSRFTPGLEIGLLITGTMLVAMAFVEFMVAPSLYAYILQSQSKRYPNMLMGFLAAAAYLPSLGLLLPGWNTTGSGFSGVVTVLGAGLITLAGYWLIKNATK
jgi:hypothetical protein